MHSDSFARSNALTGVFTLLNVILIIWN